MSRVLVIIPTLGDRPELLRETLASVARQQPEPPDTVLVCPAKATEARALARQFHASVEDDPGGLSAAINVGISKAKADHEFISWLGDDDLLTPGSLHASVAALDKNPNAVLAFGQCDYINSEGHRIFTSKAGRLAPWLMTWGPNLVPCIGLLWRRKAVEEAGGFDEMLKYSMDLDMLLKLRKKGRFASLNRTLGAFRWHPTSTTVANRKKSLAEAQLVKRRQLPKHMIAVAPLWEAPVRAATLLAAKRVNSQSRGKSTP